MKTNKEQKTTIFGYTSRSVRVQFQPLLHTSSPSLKSSGSDAMVAANNDDDEVVEEAAAAAAGGLGCCAGTESLRCCRTAAGGAALPPLPLSEEEEAGASAGKVPSRETVAVSGAAGFLPLLAAFPPFSPLGGGLGLGCLRDGLLEACARGLRVNARFLRRPGPARGRSAGPRPATPPGPCVI